MQRGMRVAANNRRGAITFCVTFFFSLSRSFSSFFLLLPAAAGVFTSKLQR